MMWTLWLMLLPGFGIENQSLVVLDENSPGLVYIQADGDNGASAAVPIFSGSTPESGSSGSSGGSITIIVRKLPEQVIISARGGNGGDGAQGSRGQRGSFGEDGRNAGLFRSPTSGTNGGDGGRGGDGSHGGHGGEGGRVRIIYAPDSKISEASDWQRRFFVDVQGGRGGEPGLGGEGGLGGRGGLGGKKFWSSRRLPSGRDGMSGEIGRSGTAGMDAEDGIVEFIEVDELPSWIVEDLLQEIEEKRI